MLDQKKNRNRLTVLILLGVALSFYFGSFIFLTNN